MTPDTPPSFSDEPAFTAPAVDGIEAAPGPTKPTAAPAASPASFAKDRVVAIQKRFLGAGGTFYVLYVLWALGLMMVLPDPTGGLRPLVSIGLLSALIGACIFLIIGWFMLKRIAAAKVSVERRKRSLFLLIVFLAPGFMLSAIMPVMIMREPPLPFDITSPTSPEDFVAPLAISFDLTRAVDILRKQGLRPMKYQWDTDGDGTMNEETVQPKITSLFEKQGSYTAVARIVLSDQSFRRLTRPVIIPRAVFSINPIQPIVERPTLFSIAHLLSETQQLDEVKWNFGDSSPQETSTTPDITHTFYAVGDYTVTATVALQNQAQVTLTKTMSVVELPPLPFPVTFKSEPARLVGPIPFGVVFSIETQEPVRDIQWFFGDDKSERGADLRRVGHSYEKDGTYAAMVRVRNASGAAAELTTIVRATTPLQLPDLRFEGSPAVSSNTVQGEVPLHLTLTPKTATPLIKFTWETNASDGLTVKADTLDGTYRKQGSYTVTLVAEDPEGKSLRLPLTITVGAPSASPSIVAKPDNGVAPLHVTFDASQTFVPPGEQLAGFQWSYGDENQNGKEAEPGPARVEHTYKQPGEFTVTLRIVMASGKEYSTQRTIIVRRPTLSACMTASRLTVKPGQAIQFDSSCSTGAPNSILWDVRSDVQPDVIVAQSPAAKYVHVFEEPGTFNVSLTVKDQWNNQNKTSLAITVERETPSSPPASSSLPPVNAASSAAAVPPSASSASPDLP